MVCGAAADSLPAGGGSSAAIAEQESPRPLGEGPGVRAAENAKCKMQIAKCKLPVSNPQSLIPDPSSASPHPNPLPTRDATDLGTPSSSLIVDVGCGTGGNLAALGRRYRCVGIDTSVEAVELAQRRFPQVQFIAGRAPQDLGELAAQAQLFLLTDVLEHVPDDYVMLSELLAAACPGSHFLVTVPADESLWSGTMNRSATIGVTTRPGWRGFGRVCRSRRCCSPISIRGFCRWCGWCGRGTGGEVVPPVRRAPIFGCPAGRSMPC